MSRNDKIKAFSLGVAGKANKKSTFAKRKEEKDARKKREDDEMAGVFQDYVDSFNKAKPASKQKSTFVRGETVLMGATESKTISKGDSSKKNHYTLGKGDASGKSEKSFIEEIEKVKKKNFAALAKPKRGKAAPTNSILDLFTAKLENAQTKEVTVEHESKSHSKHNHRNSESRPPPGFGLPLQNPSMLAPSGQGSFPSGGNDTTNLYVGNISPQTTEEILCMEFGIFGPLASVKIMWPRTQEEHARGRNCGFVAFMKREDAAKCRDALDGKELLGFELRVGWGKAVSIPEQPVYVHKSITDENAPTGLPFNARPSQEANSGINQHDSTAEINPLEQALQCSEIRVAIPKDINIRKIIHRTIEAIINEGPKFETLLMQKVSDDPRFQFLFDYTTLEHRYYRWKMCSVLQGDNVNNWSSTKFRMYDRGSYWIPPSKEDLKVEEQVKKGQLSASKRDHFEEILRNVTISRLQILDVMGFCLDNCDAAPEIVDCITEALCILETPIQHKIARFFVVSDILNNTAVVGAASFRTGFEQALSQIVGNMNAAYVAIPGRMKAELFKKLVMNCFAAWDDWALYPPEFIENLRKKFLSKPTENTIATSTATTSVTKSKSAAELLASAKALVEKHKHKQQQQQPDIAAKPVRKGGFKTGGFKAIGTVIEEEKFDGDDIDGDDLDGEDLDGEDLIPVEKKSVSKWESDDEDEDDKEQEETNRKRSSDNIEAYKNKRAAY